MPPSSYIRPSLIHAQVEFLINHLEGDWRALTKGIHHEGNHVSLYLYCQQLRDHVAIIYEEPILKGEQNLDSDRDWDADEIAMANEMGIDNFSSEMNKMGQRYWKTLMDQRSSLEITRQTTMLGFRS